MHRLISILLVTFLWCGCKNIRRVVLTQPSQPETLFGAEYTESLSKRYFGNGPEGNLLYKRIEEFDQDVSHAPTSPNYAVGTANAKRIRNQVVYDLLRISDKLYSDFKDRLFSGRAAMDAGFRITDLALTGAAAALGDKGTKTGLAAAATFLGGSKLALDENFFAKQTTASLASAMDGKRAKYRAQIIVGLSKSPQDFSLSEAISLVQQYHRAGSLIDAVVEINRITNVEANKSETELENALKDTDKTPKATPAP